MKNNSDPVFRQFADMDFSDALPVSKVPALAQLQERQGRKSRITIRGDNTTLPIFKAQAEKTGDSYQTLMNAALAQFAQGHTLSDMVRETIRQELRSA